MLNGNPPLVEEPPPVLPHHEELGVRVPLQKALGLPDGVLVIGSGQTLVGGDEQTAVGPLQGRVAAHGVEKAAVHVVGRVENPADLPPEGLEVGPGLVQLLPGPAELRGGDEVHGVGDFPGLPHTLNVGLDLLGPRHVSRPSSR